jgi:tetratricopeptide (TPR) repeat protein
MSIILAIIIALQLTPEQTLISDVRQLITTGKPLEAVALARKGLLDYPHSLPLYKALALAYRNADSLDMAIQIYGAILESYPKDSDTKVELGITYYIANRLDEAFNTFTTLYESDSTNPDAFLGFGNVYTARGELDKAIESYKKSAELAPKSAVPLRKLGQVYIDRKEYRQAIKTYSGALVNDSTDIRSRIGLAKAYESSGFPMAAIRQYDKVLAFDSTSTEASRGRERVFKQTALEFTTSIGDADERDRGIEGNYASYGFSIAKPLNDYVRPSFSYRYSRNKRADLQKDYDFVGMSLKLRPVRSFTTTFGTDADVNSRTFKAYEVSSELTYRILKVSGSALREQIEPTRDINANTVSGGVSIGPMKKLSLKSDLARKNVAEDNNKRITVTSSVSYDLFTNPSVDVSFTNSYDSYDFTSPYYYSPRDLRVNALGGSVFKNFGFMFAYFGAQVSVNSDELQTFRGQTEIGKNLTKRSRIILQGVSYHTSHEYSAYSLRIFLSDWQ